MQKLSVSLDAARGLAHLHRLGWCHLDVACRNILCRQDNGVIRGKLSDMGLSRLCDPGFSDPGAPSPPDQHRWAAPEAFNSIWRGTASDSYSFAVLLWEALSDGATPYAEFGDQYSTPISTGYTPPLNQERWPQPVCQLMTQCWHETPDRRPSMAEIVDRLRAFLATNRNLPETSPPEAPLRHSGADLAPAGSGPKRHAETTDVQPAEKLPRIEPEPSRSPAGEPLSPRSFVNRNLSVSDQKAVGWRPGISSSKEAEERLVLITQPHFILRWSKAQNSLVFSFLDTHRQVTHGTVLITDGTFYVAAEEDRQIGPFDSLVALAEGMKHEFSLVGPLPVYRVSSASKG
eukprot:TRINITY_DN4785_c0_g1_i2.p1 TRINITY_DN4785_c0_g1~~TRINITY_DN4785_c0_g1_i2.p1  ORF type:complete len:346 (+),score=32.01 TRINITY_DN4785_c0_g1_i2:954-1991(+)